MELAIFKEFLVLFKVENGIRKQNVSAGSEYTWTLALAFVGPIFVSELGKMCIKKFHFGTPGGFVG